MTNPITIPGYGEFKSQSEAANTLNIEYGLLRRMLKRDEPIEVSVARHQAARERLNIPGYGQFNSIAEAARVIGICRLALGRALKNGKPVEDIINCKSKGIPVKIGNEQYKSKRQAAEKLGVTEAIINSAIKHNVLDRPALIKKGFTHVTSKPIKIRFKKYKSLTQASKETGIAKDTLIAMVDAPQEQIDLLGLKSKDGKRLNRGMTIKCFNTLYPSVREFCRKHNTYASVVNRYLDNGIPLEQIFNKNKINKGKEVTFYNKVYPSHKFLAKMLGISLPTLRKYLRNENLHKLLEHNDERWNAFLANLRNVNWKRDVELEYEYK